MPPTNSYCSEWRGTKPRYCLEWPGTKPRYCLEWSGTKPRYCLEWSGTKPRYCLECPGTKQRAGHVRIQSGAHRTLELLGERRREHDHVVDSKQR